MAENPHARIQKLRVLAADPAASVTERATATRIADRLVEKHGEPPPTEPKSVPPTQSDRAGGRTTGPSGYAEPYADSFWGTVDAAASAAFRAVKGRFTTADLGAILDAVTYSVTETQKGIKVSAVLPARTVDLSDLGIEIVTDAVGNNIREILAEALLRSR